MHHTLHIEWSVNYVKHILFDTTHMILHVTSRINHLLYITRYMLDLSRPDKIRLHPTVVWIVCCITLYHIVSYDNVL